MTSRSSRTTGGRTIDLFALVDIPLERADRPAYRADAGRRPMSPRTTRTSRAGSTCLLLDANHVPATDSHLTKKAAHEFINYLGANDLAAVVLAQTGSRDDNQEFTNSRAALHAAVDKFVGEKVRSRTLNVQDAAVRSFGLEKLGIDVRNSKDPRSRRACGQGASDARFDDAAVELHGRASAAGARRSCSFSEGLDFNLDDTLGPRSLVVRPQRNSRPPTTRRSTSRCTRPRILDGMQAMFEAASRANVAIYSVDPRGRRPPSSTR